MSDDVVDTRLSAARTRLILERPFLGALVLRLPLVEADASWCKTTATDARAIYFNPDYIAELNTRQTQFMLAHDALHCALSHFARRQHRNKHRWDVACDFAINAMLIGEGMQAPANVLYLKHFVGMTAEEIYPMLDEDEDREPVDQHLYDDYDENSESSNSEQQESDQSESGGDAPSKRQQGGHTPGRERQQSTTNRGASRPPPLSEGERQGLETQWQQHLAGAAQTALQAGKLDGAMARLVDHFLQPQLPWRMLLARYMTSSARDDYSYIRPSSRRGSGAIFPALRSSEVNVVAAVDPSGSISMTEIQEFVSEVDGLKGQVRAAVTLVACDQEIVGKPQRFEPWEEMQIDLKSIQGGRATRFIPVFEWLEKQDRKPDLLLYFTDAEGQFPEIEPMMPVVWLIKGKQKVPWGQRIQLNG